MQFQKVFGENRNILEAVTQRWQTYLDCVESKQKILAKLACGNLGVQIRIRRGQQPDVHLLRLRRSDTLKLTCLQNTKQLWL
jgi:hypothetical protein